MNGNFYKKKKKMAAVNTAVTVSVFQVVMIYIWLATKNHVAALLPLSLLGWGGDSEEKGKTCGFGSGQFNRTAKEVNSNSNNTVKNKGMHRAALSHRLILGTLLSHK